MEPASEQRRRECGDRELAGLYKRLQALEARQASDGAASSRSYRRGFSSGLTGGAISLAVLALMGGLLYGQGGADALFIDQQGRVGIGTTKPAALLTVDVANRNDSPAALSLRRSGANPMIEWCSDKGCTYMEQSTATNSLLLGTAGSGASAAMVVQKGGNVGIGATTPRSNLDIQQAIRTGNHPASVTGLYVTGDFEPAKGVEFRHSNGSQGIGFGYNTIYSTGSNASQDLNLKPMGAGVVKVDGGLSVQGPLRAQGRYQRDDGAETMYETSPRYHLSLTAPAYAGKTKSIPIDTLVSLCGDVDGCEVRMGMTRWGNGTETETASVSFLFYYSASNGHWRSSSPGEIAGVDGNGVIEHVRNAWTCFFTDGNYANYKEQGDPDRNMQLMVWNQYQGASRTCELTLID